MIKVWVTLLTKISYLPGVLVLNHSLKCVKSQYPLVVMIIPTLTSDARATLHNQKIITRDIDSLHPHFASSYNINDRFADTWTKLRCFELVEYDRVVLLDADMLIRQNMDELMDMHLNEGEIACVHVCACNPRKIREYPGDWIPDNCAFSSPHQPVQMTVDSPRPYHLLNSGTVVLRPSTKDSAIIKRFLSESSLVSSFIFPDQDLLAEVFRGRWKPLHWRYNALKTLRVIHAPLWDDKEVKCVHYILADKPWKARPHDGNHNGYEILNRWWWETFNDMGKTILGQCPSNTALKDWETINLNVAQF